MEPVAALGGRARSLLVPLLVLGAAGCEGLITVPVEADPELPAPPTKPYLDPLLDPEGDPSRQPAPNFVPSKASLRLLTTQQYRHSVQDLFDGALLPPPVGGFAGALAAAQSGVSGLLVESYETAALDVSRRAFADGALRARIIGCDVNVASCFEQFIRRFGQRVFRRLLTDEEVERYRAHAEATAGAFRNRAKGAEMVLVAMLQSPYFLYRVELGQPTGTGLLAYTDDEMASRISYAIWNSTPDAALLSAVTAGGLATPTGIREQVRRLLASPKARDGIEQFLIDWLDIEGLSTTTDGFPVLDKDSFFFPDFDAELVNAMRQEMLQGFAAKLLEPGKNALDIYDSRETFVNERLARHYKLTGVSGPVLRKVRLPDETLRGGVLGMAGLMTLQASAVATSAVERGHKLRLMMMCQTIAVPQGVVAVLPPVDPSVPKTKREQLEEHRKNPVCAGCHEKFDPIGLGLERFDAVGAFRTHEVGKPIDVSGALEGQSFTDELGLNRAVRSNVRTAGCFVRQVYRYVTGHVEAPNEEVVLFELKRGFASSGQQFSPLLEEMTSHPSFRLASPQETQP